VLYIERRAIGAVASHPQDWLRLLRPEAWLRLSPAEANRRGVLLAQAQLGGTAPPSMQHPMHLHPSPAKSSAQESAS
jgi:hypothetical protein